MMMDRIEAGATVKCEYQSAAAVITGGDGELGAHAMASDEAMSTRQH